MQCVIMGRSVDGGYDDDNVVVDEDHDGNVCCDIIMRTSGRKERRCSEEPISTVRS